MLPSIYYNNGRSRSLLPDIFDDFFGFNAFPSLFGNTGVLAHNATPAMNVVENEKEYQVELAAPGVAKDAFSVRIENGNELTVKIEQKNDRKNDDRKNFLRHEFSYESYERSFIIPDEVDADAIEAAMHDGVLTITLPKKDEAVSPAWRQIEIR